MVFIISAFACIEHRCNEYKLITELQITYINNENDVEDLKCVSEN